MYLSHFIIGFYDSSAVKEMLKECARMYTFNHPNVLTLRGVCVDGGPAPYIIMPFMANGSLLAYLKKERAKLVVSNEDSDTEEVAILPDITHPLSMDIGVNVLCLCCRWKVFANN